MKRPGFNFWVEKNESGKKSPLLDKNGLMYFSSPLAANKYMRENGITGEVIGIYTVLK